MKYCATHIECMGCQISKEDDENRSDPQSNTENTTETKTMANKATAIADYKSRLEWKLCLVRDKFFFLLQIFVLRLIKVNYFFFDLYYIIFRQKIHPNLNSICLIAI